jgi:hypothetical protein
VKRNSETKKVAGFSLGIINLLGSLSRITWCDVLLQNRDKSVVCDEAVYLLELVRSLHLNPLRARVVADLEGLAKYADSGQVALVGTRCSYT